MAEEPKYWLVNHNWISFSLTKQYCGFVRQWEQKLISPGDYMVYFGDGLVLGLFKAEALVQNEFKGWKKPYPFQVRLTVLDIPNNPPKGGVKSDWLKATIQETRDKGGSPNLLPLSKKDFETITGQVAGK